MGGARAGQRRPAIRRCCLVDFGEIVLEETPAMKSRREVFWAAVLVLTAGLACNTGTQSTPAPARTDPLPSWNDGPAKQAILEFVEKVTDEASPVFVPPAERIVTFDNDGTLWPSHPMYTQLAFALDRVKELAPNHPEWKNKQPFKAVLDNDLEALGAAGEKGLVELVMASHAGMTTAEFESVVTAWLAKAEHPRFKRRYTELAYQPMLELLEYLRANGFKTYIVSGGGVEFMRPMTESVYGIPPEQVVGSSIKTKYEIQDGKPVLMRLPEVDFIDDKTGKPVGINKFIGRRPVAAFGNSDGDREMLEWTGVGDDVRLMMLVFHDDAEREYAYGPANGLEDTKFGTFSQSLMDEAKQKGWVVISMKDDWKQIFASAS
jgi:phosphoglycolate phosphatase-like HAD superfamily hydrolase